MTKTAPARSWQAIQTEALELVRKAIILHPDLPADQLSQILIAECERDYWRELSKALASQFFTKHVLSERRKADQPEAPPPLFEGLEHLPLQIRIKGKRYAFEKTTATQLRAYLRTANKRHKQRLQDVKAALEIMESYAREHRGITAAEVAAKEAEKARKR